MPATVLVLSARGSHAGRQLNDVVHRVAIYDNECRVTNIISQTDIVRWVPAIARHQ